MVTLNGTKVTRLIYVWGLVLNETYVLIIHIPGPDGFTVPHDQNPKCTPRTVLFTREERRQIDPSSLYVAF